MNKVYSNILKLRKANSLSQTDLAEKLGISQDAVSKLEKGGVQLTIERLEQLAEIFGMSIDDILHYGEEKTQIVDNEKIKELENKVLLLEKDLEICKNRYELSRNELKNGFLEVLRVENFLQDVTEFIFRHIIEPIIKKNISNTLVLIEELNSFTTKDFLIQLNYILEDIDEDYEFSLNHSPIVVIFKILSEVERNDILLKELRNLYAAVFINFEWSDEKYNQAIEECKELGFDFTKKDIEDVFSLSVALDRHIIYEQKIKPKKLLKDISLKNLKEYKHIPEIPTQTGFFRLV